MTASIVALAAALSAPPAWAATKFVQNVHKAQSRKEPAERVEYYRRALDAWEPAEGNSMLAYCHYGRGQALAELWRWEEAEPDLSKALEKDPVNAGAYLLRGRVRLRLNRMSEASQDLLEYVGRKPLDVSGLVLLSEAQLRLGRGDAALKTCRMAQQAEPEDPRGFLCEGRALMARKDWAGAERVLSLADQRAKGGLADAPLERAVCRVAQGRHEDALADYARALPLLEESLGDLPGDAPKPQADELRQATARAYYGRGRVLEFLIKREEALADYTRACGHGHAQACERAAGLAQRDEPRPKRKAPPAHTIRLPETPEPPKRAKPRQSHPDEDPGERIYGS